MPKTFLPRDAAARATFLNNLVFELELERDPDSLATTLNIEVARMNDLKADAAAYGYAVSVLVPAARRFDRAVTKMQASISANNSGEPVAFPQFPTLAAPPVAVRPGIFKRLSMLVRHIKSQPTYTVEIGEILGINTSGESDNGTVIPKPSILFAKALPGSHIRVKFIKGGYKLVLIEGRRAGETTWTLLDKVSSNIYLDTRAPLTSGQPEVREYRVRYLEKDQPIGEYSDVISVTTTP